MTAFLENEAADQLCDFAARVENETAEKEPEHGIVCFTWVTGKEATEGRMHAGIKTNSDRVSFPPHTLFNLKRIEENRSKGKVNDAARVSPCFKY